ncbi:MAG: RnfABCDGE type electron transport complex subunit G [bacterium]|nr:RnfABCDGE type electron transport complex subunit G [bacterium]MDD3625091.1 RnfABCDGE type electron transport complex subunit G [Proteiniphilum sp.]MDD3968348.1 RnfABCDGE type electron transport complex subunit G [Proteiniphilum sp.]MDD4459526.1 RnfABCDGE type electron transport complex subunit G [Proteiniphilum sp.]
MAKLQSSFRNMFLSLSLICLTVALLLAQVNKMTATPIAAAKAMKLQNAIREVVPAFDNDPVAEAYRMTDGSGDSLLVYPAKKGDELVGFALNSYSNNGFSGNIQIMVGFDMKHRIVNYAVLQHAETPGLGSKMTEWFRDATKPGQSVIGRDLSQGALTVSKEGGNVDAITASTITSRAFLEAVNRAYAAYSGSRENALSGATIATDKEQEKTKREGGDHNE